MPPPAPAFALDVDAISGICGQDTFARRLVVLFETSISIACWVVVFSPQIIQQFRQGNADGLSIQFIIIWLLGDVFNIAGALLQGVLPTMTILAIYYTFADIILLGQCFYYRGFTWRDEPASPAKPAVREPSERTALLPSGGPVERSDWTGLSPAVAHVPEAPEPRAPPHALQSAAWNATIVAMVCAAGVLGWFLGERSAGGRDEPSDAGADRLEFNVPGQVFGYLCAVAYIASRMPQLILSWRRKTTDGLSMPFSLFACFGNVMYVLSILAYDPKCPGGGCAPGEAGRIYGRYILVNLSWLMGSFVTLLMDLAVFVQYFVYKTEDGRGQTREGNRGRAGEERWDRPLLERSDTSN